MKRKPIKRILCPIDFSDFSGRAYEYAASLAQRYDARLFVQHVVERWRYPCADFVTTFDQYESFCKNLYRLGEQRLREFVRERGREGWCPDCVTQEGIADECILSFAQQEDVSLIVIGTHGIRGADRIVLGSVTETVLRKAHCPVLAVHDEPRKPLAVPHAASEIELHEILCCIDFSEQSKDGLEYALSLANEFSATLTLAHVLEGRTIRGNHGDCVAEAERMLNSLIPIQPVPECRIEKAVRPGSPYKEICKLAYEIDADLIVMGVQGRNSMDDRVFGSTTYRVVQLSGCPVLAIHPYKELPPGS